MKRIRTTNSSFDEINELVSVIERHSGIIENKTTDVTSKFEKEKAWGDVADVFNSQRGTARSAKILQNKWDALKKQTKVEYNKIKNYNQGTGGGPRGPSVCMSTLGERILKIVGIAITGTNSPFDCDAASQAVNINTEEEDSDLILEGTENVTDTVEVNNIKKICNDSGDNNTSMLINTEENSCNATTESVNSQNTETLLLSIISSPHDNNTWKKWTPNNIRQEKNAVLNINKRSLQENIPKAMKKLVTRRRVTNKEKEQNMYIELAASKLELVQLQKQTLQKEHEMEQEKKNLEIKLLKIELERKKNYCTCNKL